MEIQIEENIVKDLRESHAELMLVAQACFERLLNGKKLNRKLDVLMARAGVKPGFAERAETAKRAIDWEMRKRAAEL